MENIKDDFSNVITRLVSSWVYTVYFLRVYSQGGNLKRIDVACTTDCGVVCSYDCNLPYRRVVFPALSQLCTLKSHWLYNYNKIKLYRREEGDKGLHRVDNTSGFSWNEEEFLFDVREVLILSF